MAKFTCNFISYSLRRTVDITVIIPTPTIPESSEMMRSGTPCSHTPKAPYPVLYLLHGMGNNHATWNGYTNIELYAEEQQIAVVCPSGESKGYIPNGRDNFFQFISEELPDFVCGMFPISKRPEDTFLAGLSMGGYGTLVHGLSHPERFAAIGVFSAATVPIPSELTKDPEIFQKSIQDGSLFRQFPYADPRYEPKALAEALASEGKAFPRIYMACGDADAIYARAAEYRDLLRSLGADVTWDELPDYDHEWRFWDIEVEKYLNWIPRTDFYSMQEKRRV